MMACVRHLPTHPTDIQLAAWRLPAKVGVLPVSSSKTSFCLASVPHAGIAFPTSAK